MVEDDAQVIESVQHMLLEMDIETVLFSRPSQLLKIPPPVGIGCLIVDLNLPEMTGMELIEKAREIGWRHPFIMISGAGEVPDAVAAMRLGACNFLQKPIIPEALVSSVRDAIDQDIDREARDAKKRQIAERMSRLTKRENEVLDLIVDGKMNKQIAEELSVSVKTVEAHRSNLTRKLDVASVAQLVRFVVESRNELL